MLRKALYSLVALAAIGAAATAASASTTTVTLSGSSAQSNGTLATAVFTFSANQLNITLTNDLNDPTSAGNLLGGVLFTITGPGAGSTPSGLTTGGFLIDISDTAPHAPSAYGGSTSAELGHWGFSTMSVSPNSLRVAGNDPLIIGYGNGGTAGSNYTDANPSLTGSSHQPFIQKTATFTMTIAGLTEGSDVSGVQFLFGTTFTAIDGTGTDRSGTPPTPGTPLPASAWSGLSLIGAIGLGALARRKMRPA